MVVCAEHVGVATLHQPTTAINVPNMAVNNTSNNTGHDAPATLDKLYKQLPDLVHCVEGIEAGWYSLNSLSLDNAASKKWLKNAMSTGFTTLADRATTLLETHDIGQGPLDLQRCVEFVSLLKLMSFMLILSCFAGMHFMYVGWRRQSENWQRVQSWKRNGKSCIRIY